MRLVSKSSLLLSASAALQLLITPVLAQTWSACNPMWGNVTCPNNPALGTTHDFVFNTSSAVTTTFNQTSGSLAFGTNGAEFTVAKRGDSPTIQSKWYIFFGTVSVVMRAATGQGIISSIVLESDDLDEVDWEFMGGNATHAETNYFGKGNTTSFDRAIYYPVDTDVRDNFHNYTLDWTAERLIWMIDGKVVRTLPYAAANEGKNYPQTPMNLRLGIWAGGDPSMPNGTIEWAGGPTDFTKGPYTMYVKSADVRDQSTGAEYQWTDTSGNWQSIKAIAGNSTAVKDIVKSETPVLTTAQKWAALPQTTKLAVYGGGGAAVALLFFAFLFVFMRQRKAGRKERDIYNARVEAERQQAYKDQMELREKGYGGWDNSTSHNEDSLGGWGGQHVPQGHVAQNDFPLRSQSPAQQWNGGNQGGPISNAGNAYNGGYSGGYAGGNQIPRSPSFRGNNGGYQRF
ncbi:glycoside hydrolase family 16 protein [Halenospora varia]|nr:glycoside hydrolase family 16 protein [Halenospora varia]